MNYNEASIELHEKHRGKWGTNSLVSIETKDDLSLAYTPGVAAVCLEIAKHPERAYDLTMKRRTVAVVTDGTAILGLGNIGALAGLPVMEGKCILYKRFADIDAVPICLEQGSIDEIVATIKRIAPTFGAIQLEDFAAPACFEITRRLEEELDIPVMQDDQYGTAIVTLAGLLNALNVVGKNLEDVQVVISGAGAAGLSIADLLLHAGVTSMHVLDSKGTIVDEAGYNEYKRALARRVNPTNTKRSIKEVIQGADVFIGVSQPDVLTRDDVAHMNARAIVFAMANPTPEIFPDEALAGGAAVVATGRSDFPNQVNNVLAYPGLFKGVLDHRLKKFTIEMYLSAAYALAGMIEHPTAEYILPSVFDTGVADVVATAVILAPVSS